MTVRLPDFVVVGAQRSGSTSLYRYLDSHPEIFMAATKELHFFDRHFDRGLGWYAGHFADATPDQVVGEATPRYMCDAAAVERLASTLPDGRFLAILRNPVDRAYSHYWMERARGREPNSFEEAIAAEDARDDPEVLPAYLGQGRYLAQLERLVEHVGRDQLLVVLFDDLRQDAEGTYSEICRFLGVDDGWRPERLGQPVNQFVGFRSLTLRRVTKLIPPSIPLASRALGRLNATRQTSYPPMSPETRQRLVDRFAAENHALGAWLDRDLGAWNRR